jgi:hypothetical protein
MQKSSVMTIVEHLRERHLNTKLHTTWVDEVEGVATFPLWNLTGQLTGYQQYRPSASKKPDNNPRDSRYFTWRKDKVVGIWGLESWNLSNTLFVTEGVFDAARLTSMGAAAVATLSNEVSPSLARWLWIVGRSRRIVTVCDDDAAGKKLAKYGHTFHVVTGYHDMGEASDSYVENFLREYK